MKNRKTIACEIQRIYLSGLEGPIESVITFLKESSNGLDNPSLEIEHGYDDEVYFLLNSNRLETDKEYNLRLENEKRRDIMIKEREINMLKELKKKYES